MSRRKPKGKTPSLIGGTNGRPKLAIAKRKCECSRCHDELSMGTECIDIPKLGGAYSSARRVCKACFDEILEQTSADLEELKAL